MPVLHIRTYAGSYRLSRVWSRRLAGKLHHTWETGSSLPVGGDHCTHGGPFVCTAGLTVLYYEIVYGTEWYGTVRNETETKYNCDLIEIPYILITVFNGSRRTTGSESSRFNRVAFKSDTPAERGISPSPLSSGSRAKYTSRDPTRWYEFGAISHGGPMGAALSG